VNTAFLAAMDASVWVFDFAPGSHNLLFTTRQAGISFVPHYDLFMADVTSTVPALTLVLPAGQGGIASFSMDGEWMTVYHPGGLDLVHSDGSEGRNIFTYPEGYEPATFGPLVTWLPDSSGFVVYHIPDPVVSLAPGELWFIPVIGEPEIRFVVNSTWGVSSPDGQRLGYSSPGTPSEIHIVETDGTDTIYKSYPAATFGG
jgi:hypothetical protein